MADDTGFMAPPPRGSSWVSLLYVRTRVIDTDEKHGVSSDVLGFVFFSVVAFSPSV